MSDSVQPLQVSRSTPVSSETFRQRVVSVLDNTIFKAIFGAALPLLVVVALWDPFSFSFGPPIEKRLRFDFTGRPLLSLVAVETVVFMIWAFAQPRGKLVARVSFALLCLGTALAAAWAILIAIPVLWSIGSEPIDFTLILLCGIMVPSLTCALFFRQACVAWKKSETASHASPARAVLTVVGTITALCGGATLLGIQAGRYAMDELRSDRADAVDSALPPLRLAAILRGEDRLLPLYERESDAAVRERFELAFRRLTGQTVEARQLELHPYND